MSQNLDSILYAKKPTPTGVKRRLDKLFDRVEIEERVPYEPLFQFNLQCYNKADELCCTVRYGWSEKELCWFFEDITKEI